MIIITNTLLLNNSTHLRQQSIATIWVDRCLPVKKEAHCPVLHHHQRDLFALSDHWVMREAEKSKSYVVFCFAHLNVHINIKQVYLVSWRKRRRKCLLVKRGAGVVKKLVCVSQLLNSCGVWFDQWCRVVSHRLSLLMLITDLLLGAAGHGGRGATSWYSGSRRDWTKNMFSKSKINTQKC